LKKIRKLSFLGVLGVVIAVLFLISISFTQAQVQTQGKPDKPPGKPDKPGEEEATWAVQLPGFGTEDTMLYGDGNMYVNNGNDVRIKVEKGYSRISKGQTAFHYYFCFKLVNETSHYAGFQSVELYTANFPDDGPFCIFPGECGSETPTCLECFLNKNQPHPEYEYFYLKFKVGQHSFTEHFPDYIIDGIEDEYWGDSDPVKFISKYDWIKIRVQNQEDFSYPYSEYHNVECYELNDDDDDLTNMNIWIEKLNKISYPYYNGITSSDGVWRIHVINEDLWVQEQYTKRAEGKGKKGGTKTVTVVPLEAEGNFYFFIDFIKNPTAQ